MKTLFIINPVAGRKRSAKVWKDIRPYINFPYEYEFTQGCGDATQIAKHAKKLGYEVIVTVGGDGTISEVVNGIAGSDIRLGIIPAGTGNDFGKTLKIPENPRYALEIIEEGKNLAFTDLGKFQDGYFINIAGAGFDAEVANMTNSNLKFLNGTLAYVASLVWNLARYSPCNAVITVDGKKYFRKPWLVLAANARYFGGGMMINPDGIINDGLLDVCIINDMSRAEILRFLPSVFTGSHKKHRCFEVIRGKNVEIEFAKPVRVQVDGDAKGFTPVRFSIVNRALSVITPVKD